MSQSISSAHKNLTATGANATNGLSELASRAANKSPAAGAGGTSFAQLMSQHTQEQPKPAPVKPSRAPEQNAHASKPAPAKPAQPATAPVRTEAPVRPSPTAQMQANQGANQSANRPERQTDAQRNAKASGSKPQADDGAKKAETADGKGDARQAKAQGGASGAQAGQSAQAESAGSQTHANQQNNALADQASLMAWLSQQPGQQQPGTPMQGEQAVAAGAPLVDGQPVPQAGVAGRPGAGPVELGADKQAGLAGAGATGPGGIKLEGAGWRAAHGPAELQVDAMLGRKGEEAQTLNKAEAGSFSGVMAHAMRGPETHRAAHAPVTEQATLQTPVHSPDFAQALADKVSMWVSKASMEGPMQAELHLNPAELGPINVKISLDGQSAHVDFAAAALETRKAIEASMPLLSSALDSVGLSLTGGGVSDQTAQQNFAQNAGQGNAGRTGRGGTGRVGESSPDDHGAHMRPVAAPRAARLGGLDLYA